MEKDYLSLFNLKLAEEIIVMSDDELWSFLLDKQEFINDFVKSRRHAASTFFYGLSYGIERLKEMFDDSLEEYREGVIFSMAMDFGFTDEKIYLDFWARSGFLDSEDSCDAIMSEEIMPPVDEESDEFYRKKYFHLLEPRHIEHIIQAMETNFGKLEKNTSEDIEKIKQMKEHCLNHEGFKVAYVYDVNYY